MQSASAKQVLLVCQISMLLGTQQPTTVYQATTNFISKITASRSIVYEEVHAMYVFALIYIHKKETKLKSIITTSYSTYVDTTSNYIRSVLDGLIFVFNNTAGGSPRCDISSYACASFPSTGTCQYVQKYC